MAVSDWSTSASSNTAVGAVNIAEGCPAANMNNAMREVMAQLRSVLTDAAITVLAGATVDDIRAALGAADSTDAIDALGELTPSADQLPYFTGASAAGLTELTAFIRTLLDDADAATARSTLGAIGIISFALASPGHIRFSISGVSTVFQIAWGKFSANANGSTTVNYQTAFPTASFPVISGSGGGTNAQDNWPAVQGDGAASFSVFSAADAPVACWYIAVGY